MTDHDGILTLLQIPDPTEKKLALKSKQVEPYHLRLALQDADPHVRATAAAHPALSRELMTEILAGEDKDLKHIVLQRPDIEEDHLDMVAEEPDHALAVAEHPKCTDRIRERAAMHHAVPPEVKALHVMKLAKNIGYITYPLLGESKVYTGPMHLTPAQGKTRIKYSGSPKELNSNTGGWMSHTLEDRSPTKPSDRTMTGAVYTQDRPGSPETQARYPDANPVKQFLRAKKIDMGKRIAANEGHEAQHSLFSRLAQKYGQEARYRIVATTLSKLSPEHRAHIHYLRDAGGLPEDPIADPEESVAYLHNYLQDPNFRAHIHRRAGIVDKDAQRQSFDQAHKAWTSLRRIAMDLKPEEVGISPQTESNTISNWLKTLGKRESMPSDQLGFSVSFLEAIAICEFLTGREVDQQTLRRAIMDADDGLGGILTAFGLNTPEGRKSYDSVKTLKLHKAQDFLKSPKQIEGMDSPELAEEIRKAYAKNEVEPVRLWGKHSSGTYIAHDTEGSSWLLKPGSGKKSPAAGVDETAGSQSRREALFSAIGEWLGVEEVQPAGLLLIDGREVACIKMWPLDWVNLHRTIADEPTLPRMAIEPYRRNGKIFRWSVLDFVAGNPDRHGDNLMVGPANEGNKIGLIDHGSSLAGYGFDPGNDQSSFVPYYLRVWAGKGFHNLSHADKIRQMPELMGVHDDELREWIASLNSDELEKVCLRYGMDPGPCLARLAQVKDVPDNIKASVHLNSLWLEPPAEALPLP